MDTGLTTRYFYSPTCISAANFKRFQSLILFIMECKKTWSGFRVLLIPCLFLFVGCNVYHTQYTSLDKAVESKNRVKIVTDKVEVYEFKSIEKNGEGYLGVTRKNSETAKKLKDQPMVVDGKFLKFHLDESKVYGVYLKNKGISNAVNIGVPVVSAAGLLGLTDKDFRPNIGN